MSNGVERLGDSELIRLHQRLDEIIGRINRVGKALVKVRATCGICGRIVLGNGSESIDVRVSKLEQDSGTRQRLSAMWLGFLAAVVGAVLTVAAERLL